MHNVNTGSVPIVSLNAATSGNGAALDNGACMGTHTAEVVSSGTITAGSVKLQGSHDNTNWVDISSAFNIGAQPNPFGISVSGQAWEYIRAAIGTAVSGGTVTVTVGSSD